MPLLKKLSPLVGLLFLLLLTSLGSCSTGSAPEHGRTAPSISCNDIDGEYFSLDQLRGKVVVLFFWSSKCCSDKVKLLDSFYASNKDKGIAIVAVEVGGAKEAVAAFAKNNNLTFTNLTDEYEFISRSYRVIGYPTMFLIGKDGTVQKRISGEVDNDQLGKLVAPLL